MLSVQCGCWGVGTHLLEALLALSTLAGSWCHVLILMLAKEGGAQVPVVLGGSGLGQVLEVGEQS
jgi:hypothetical protein